jgi:hypothetical protein
MVNQTTRPSNGLPELQTEYFLAERDKEQSHNACIMGGSERTTLSLFG